jgi:hypothetical protein
LTLTIGIAKLAGILDMPLLGQIRAATAGHVIVRYP